MKDTRYGKTSGGNEVVYYYLSDGKDVFRLIEGLLKKLHTNLFVYPNNSVRFVQGYKSENDNVLCVMILSNDAIAENSNLRGREVLSADEVGEYANKLIKELDFKVDTIELVNGLYAIDVTEFVDDDTKIYELYMKLFNQDADFYLQMGDDVELFTWRPSVLETRYVIKPVITYQSGGSEPDFIQNSNDEVIFV